jgi:hypothetical protein
VSTLQTINLKNPAYGDAYNVQLDAYGSITVANSITSAGYIYGKNGLRADVGFIPPFALYLKNRIINGGFNIAQRGVGPTNISVGTAGPTTSTGYTTVDRWFTCSANGGTIPTATQTTNATTGEKQLTVTGAATTTNVYIGQRIEAANSFDLAGQTVTLSFYASDSLVAAQSLTVTLSYANTTDTFGTIATPTKTIISPISPGTGIFALNGTLPTTPFSVSYVIPAGVTSGLEVLFTVGAQTSGTFVLQNVQLELGANATAFDRRPITQEIQLCQRYYEKSFPLTQTPAQLGGRQGAWQTIAAGAGAVVNGLGLKPFAVTKRLNISTFTASSAASTMTVTGTPTIPILNGSTILSGPLAANLPAAVIVAVAGGGAGAYTTNRAIGTVASTTFTALVGPTITTYNPDVANANVRDIGIGVAAIGDCATTTLLSTSDNGFSLYATGNASTAAGDTLAVHWTAEIEIP